MTPAESHIAPEILHRLLVLDTSTWSLKWLPRTKETHPFLDLDRWNTRYADSPAFFSVTSKGYLRGIIYKRHIFTHRVIWAMVTGAWPREFIDHINGNVRDNRISNLREVSAVGNGMNQKRHVTNKTGKCGVCWAPKQQRFQAYIRVDGSKLHLGTFKQLSDAINARESAEQKYGFHPNHGEVRCREV